MKTKICAITLAIAAAAPAIADDFTYVSGGLLYQLGEKKHSFNNTIKDNECKIKNNAFGFYLNGSLGINDYFFAEGRLHDTELERQVLLGIGGHYPVAQYANLYALAGIAKKNLASISNKDAEERIYKDSESRKAYPLLPKSANEIRDDIQPTIELGAKLRVDDEMGARISYRYARFDQRFLKTEKKHLHEVHLGGYYQVAESCAVEAGYNFTRFQEKINNHKITAGIRYNL